ncbi:PREDICTED: thioredoxin domain-containing protein 17-like [Vollenhovia emeryi]|uniref:thioredoxin domain-containing protein 17-like n=1 Tax=Vollenhovia emeryi TaxID=411798 RepID=UPI0005F52A7D|nr:PREDICTED: thioredoxin domain-containing protein 17-like [Vollenhovia emeryi]
MAFNHSSTRSPTGRDRREPDSAKMEQIGVDGYDNFLRYVEQLRLKRVERPTYILFTGSPLPGSDESWCSDCVEAEPFISKAFLGLAAEAEEPKRTLFVKVTVGDRAFWKDQHCPFRTDPITKLKVLPTLIKWGTQKRLEGDQLLKPELIELLLCADEDD